MRIQNRKLIPQIFEDVYFDKIKQELPVNYQMNSQQILAFDSEERFLLFRFAGLLFIFSLH